jgi:Antibiotic biosynthesis monooxygenase
VSELLGIARFKFHEGKLEEFKRLSAQCMEIVRTKDTGTLQYEIYINDDQSEGIVLERYEDSEALMQHTWVSDGGDPCQTANRAPDATDRPRTRHPAAARPEPDQCRDRRRARCRAIDRQVTRREPGQAQPA